MIHGDIAKQEKLYDCRIYSSQLYDGQISGDGFYERDLVPQMPEENNSPYNNNVNEIDLFPNNEVADLAAIDSSDLLQLESESALNELIESTNIKPTVNHPQMISNEFPNLEEHDYEGYRFELNLSPNTCGKSNWYYSPKLQKVFIKLDQTFYIDAIYSPKNLCENLYLRAMMVFIDDISSPVQRCHNHMNSDRSQDSCLKYYILRSENSGIKYEGKFDGRNMNDRLSVIIPLGQSRPNENNIVKYSVALKFVCQNSCIGRKQTAVIFTLEDQNCYILGKKVVNVKVCSCPKRDKHKDEEKFASKRPASDQRDCPPTKIPSIVRIKEETMPGTSLLSNSCMQQPIQTINVANIENNDFEDVKYEISIPKFLAYDVSRSVFNVITGAMALDNKNTEKYRKCLKDAKQKMDEFSQNSVYQHQSSRCLKK